MLVELRTSAQARRLELDGYSRTGKNAIEAPLSGLDKITDRDDVTVSKVSLRRSNGDDEAEVINREIRKHSGRVEKEHIEPSTYNFDDPFDVRKSKVFKISEDEMTIYDDYQAVIDGDYTLRPTHDEFEEIRDRVLDEIDERIAKFETYFEDVQNTSLGDLIDLE